MLLYLAQNFGKILVRLRKDNLENYWMSFFFSFSPKHFWKSPYSRCSNVVFSYWQQYYLSIPEGIWWFEFNTHIFFLILYQTVALKKKKILSRGHNSGDERLWILRLVTNSWKIYVQKARLDEAERHFTPRHQLIDGKNTVLLQGSV